MPAKKKAAKKATPKKKAASKKKAAKKKSAKSSRATRADLARKLKKSRSYISQLVKKGVVKIGKDKKLDLKEAVQAYKNFIDPTYVDNSSTDKPESGFAKSRAKTEKFKAKVAELDYQERVGELISAAIVQKQQFEAARACRDALLSIPGRLSPELSGMEDRKKIERTLEAAILEALKRLSSG